MWKGKRFIFVLFALAALDSVQCKRKKVKKPAHTKDDTTHEDYFRPSAMEDQDSFRGIGRETTTMGLYAPAFPTHEDANLDNNHATFVESFMSNMPSGPGPSASMTTILENLKQRDYNIYNPDFVDSPDAHEHELEHPMYGTKIKSKVPPSKPGYDMLNYENIYNEASTWPTTNSDNVNDVKYDFIMHSNFKKGPPTSDDYVNETSGIRFTENTHDFTTFPSTQSIKYSYSSEPKSVFPTSISHSDYKQQPSTYKYQESKDPMSPNFKSPHFDQGNFKQKTPKDSYVGGSLFHDQLSGLDSQYSNKFTDTVNILPSKKHLNYTDPKYDFRSTELYRNYEDQHVRKPTIHSSKYNSIENDDWKGAYISAQETNTYSTIPENYRQEEYSTMKYANQYTDHIYDQSNVANVVDFTRNTLKNNNFNSPNSYENDWKGTKNSSAYSTIPDRYKEGKYKNTYASQYADNYSGDNYKNVIDFTKNNNPFKDSMKHATLDSIRDENLKNVIDFTKTQDYSAMKNSIMNTWKTPVTKFPTDEEIIKHFGYDFLNAKSKPEAAIQTTHWGSIFKNPIPSKPNSLYTEDDDNQTKKKFQHLKIAGRSPTEWNKEVNRFKSEEDLLGLRNHDTSHPSYVPDPGAYRFREESIYHPSHHAKMIGKWRQMQANMKKVSDLEEGSSDADGRRVPHPGHYPVEIPQPVIVPVPEPYPVHVPVSNPIAVPVLHEIKFTIEKPVPYPVYKKVPYPVEKPVPVPIEKPVPVPVMEPVPVPIPHVRPVFHHGKHHRRPSRPNRFEEDDQEETRERKPKTERFILRPARNRRIKIRPRRPTDSYHLRRVSKRPQRSRSNYRRTTRPLDNTPSRFPRKPDTNRQKRPRKENRLKLLDEELYDHNHDDYFMYCQNNPLCYISDLRKPFTKTN